MLSPEAVTLFFPRNVEAIIAAKALKEAGVESRLEPVTDHFTSNVLCVKVDAASEMEARRVLSSSHVTVNEKD